MIGVFDSGLGGLSVLREVRAQLPKADVLYFGDNAHIPYGPRPPAEIRAFAEAITRFLLDHGAQLIVVACNAASAAALKYLRQTYPKVPFVGMEPAVKPAVEQTQTRVIGVLATPTTLRGELFNLAVERFAQDVTVLKQACPGLVEQVEAGATAALETETMLRRWVEPMLAQQADALVLGCTHYSFIIPALKKICGPAVRVIDPAPAVARQVWRVARRNGLELDTASSGGLTYFTSGESKNFSRALTQFGIEPGEIRAVRWEGNEIKEE